MVNKTFRILASLSMIFCFFLCFAFPVSANNNPVFSNVEVKYGWVEFRADTPSGFKGIIIISIVNKSTFETYDFDILPENNYRTNVSVPVGQYYVEYSFVYENISSSVQVTPITFSVNEDSAATLVKVIVTTNILPSDDIIIPDDPTASTEPSETTSTVPSPSTENTEGTTKPSAGSHTITPEPTDGNSEPSSDDSFVSTIGRVILVLLGTGIFLVFIVIGVLLYRRHVE